MEDFNENLNKSSNLLSKKSARVGLVSNSNSLDEQLRVYAVPIISILLFFVLIVFVTIPSIDDFFKKRDEETALKSNLDELQIELRDLKSLAQSDELNDSLIEELNRIIPTAVTQVYVFGEKVNEVASSNIINIKDFTIGEQIIVSNNSTGANAAQNQTELKLIQIPIQFELSGQLSNFRDMLSQIYEGRDFIVISKMKLDIDDYDMAEIELVLSKYQFADFSTPKQERQILDSVSYKESAEQSVIEFIERKSTGIGDSDKTEETNL